MRINSRSIKNLNMKDKTLKLLEYKQMYLGLQVKKGFLQQNIKGVNHRRQDSTTLKLRNSSHQKILLYNKGKDKLQTESLYL